MKLALISDTLSLSEIFWLDCFVLVIKWKHVFWTFMNHLTNPFTILEPRDQEIGEFYVVQDLEAPKL